MIIVFQTQVRENYGAHDWDGNGECPQHWKNKGGDTYIVQGATLQQLMSEQFYHDLYDVIETKNNYLEEYVIRWCRVDEEDFNLADHIDEDWQSPIYLAPADDYSGDFMAVRHTDLREECVGICEKHESWYMVKGERKDYKCVYKRDDGTFLNWKGEVIGEAA